MYVCVCVYIYIYIYIYIYTHTHTHTHTHATDVQKDLINLVETVENLYLYLTDVHKEVKNWKEVQVNGDDVASMRAAFAPTGQVNGDDVASKRAASTRSGQVNGDDVVTVRTAPTPIETGLEALKDMYPHFMRRLLGYLRTFRAFSRNNESTPDAQLQESGDVAREIMRFG